MNQGVQMLLARMDSHPEEFSFQFGLGDEVSSRWAAVMDDLERRVSGQFTSPPLPFLSDEEIKALHDKYIALQGDAFTHYVMNELLG